MDYLSSDKIAIIDLASGEIIEEDLSEELVQANIGGAGITQALYEQHKDGDPLVIGTGLLTGTMMPGAGLGVLTGKSPVTGKVAHAPLLQDLGMELKYSGFDYVVIKGESPKPVYLWLHDGIADLNDAADLWGQEVWASVDSVRQAMGDELIQVMAIGPAGENLSDLAAVSANHWSSGDRFGFGKVMGQKKVKLMAVRGMGLLEVSDPESYMERCAELLEDIKEGATAGKKGIGDIAAALGATDVADWIAPLVHRSRACFNTPYAANTFLFLKGDPAQLVEPSENEPGVLLTDPLALIELKKMGLAALDAGLVLQACAKTGLDPLAVAVTAAKAGSKDAAGIIGQLSGMTGPSPVTADTPFSPWAPPQPLFATFEDQGTDWWAKRQALAYLFGLNPMFALMSPEIDVDALIDLADMGAELDLNDDSLGVVVSRLLQ